MNFNDVDKKSYIKSDELVVNDLFVVVRENGHQTPYLLMGGECGTSLLNLHSGSVGYEGYEVSDSISNYLCENTKDKSNTNEFSTININQITEYFFVKSSKLSLNVKETFGYRKIETDV